MRVPWCKAGETTIGDIECLNIVHMAKTKELPNCEHAQLPLDMADLLETPDKETIRVDGSIPPTGPPTFGEWRLKGLQAAWLCKMAPTDQQPSEVWPAL